MRFGYDASKAGVVRMTEALAVEAADAGVKTFTVFPGCVRTRMTEFIMESPEGRKWRPQFREIFTSGRDVPPEAMARLAVELVSGRADALSGRYLSVADDLDGLVADAEHIVGGDRLTLRLRQ